MNLYIINHHFKYEIEKLCRVFFWAEKLTLLYEFSESNEDYVLTLYEKKPEGALLSARVRVKGREKYAEQFVKECDDFDKNCEYLFAAMLYDIFCELTGYTPKWGILTGVRPTKLMRRLIKDFGNEERAADYFEKKLFVSPEKTGLCLRVAKAEDEILSKAKPDGYSLYISIPFCPTRCRYCSFVSHSIEKARNLLEPYVNLLCEEIVVTARIANQLKLKLQTIYFGGGTPTVLTAEQLKRVMRTITGNFDLSGLLEYTVEAGRPDTITQEKLEEIKAGGATRISINPQTMHDEILENIGRNHTVKQTLDAFKWAREAGFDNINMDLIAGLPGETPESFQETVEQVLSLDPQNMTIHTLALKRSSDFKKQSIFTWYNVEKMLSFAEERLTKNGFFPYYMYRQSNMASNLENVGYSKKGHEGIYNVYIMDEVETILACGGGGVTKLKQRNGERIERIFNYKYPYEYNTGFHEIIKRKERVSLFYNEYNSDHAD